MTLIPAKPLDEIVDGFRRPFDALEEVRAVEQQHAADTIDAIQRLRGLMNVSQLLVRKVERGEAGVAYALILHAH
jgi:hypothetical protein